ncbi:MAG TPA: hypothetical protein VEX64_06595 [Pyrinomonadaceae bacterium]|jgi:hypothetical protein|nr:hypothetical protein [Pyrinomonadaceae bacterium]
MMEFLKGLDTNNSGQQRQTAASPPIQRSVSFMWMVFPVLAIGLIWLKLKRMSGKTG